MPVDFSCQRYHVGLKTRNLTTEGSLKGNNYYTKRETS